LSPTDKTKERPGPTALHLWCKTDLDGQFRIVNVPPGTYLLEVELYRKYGLGFRQAARHDPLVAQAGRCFIGDDFVVETPEDRGHLLVRAEEAASGIPITTFSLKIPHVDIAGKGTAAHGLREMDGQWMPLQSHDAIKADDGVVRIESISPGTATLEISVDGYLQETPSVRIVSGQTTEVTVTLVREGILEGVATRAGKPGAYGYVSARRIGGPPKTEVNTSTNGTGYYQFRGLRAGRYRVCFTVWLREGPPNSAQLTNVTSARVASGETTRLDIDFDGQSTIRGRFSADKKLNWLVMAYDARATETVSRRDALRGSAWKMQRYGEQYSIENLPAGKYIVVGSTNSKDERAQLSTIQATTKTVTVDEGGVAEVDFEFP
jgi:hypothetical protein